MFAVTVVTPEMKVLMGAECEEIFVPGFRGELNILPGHAPLLTTLENGILKYRLKGETKMNHLAVGTGYCQVNPNGVLVMTDTAEVPEEIDVERAKASFAAADKLMQSGELDSETLVGVQAQMNRAVVRQEVAKLAGTPVGVTAH